MGWDRIVAFCRQHAPEALDAVPAPAPPDAIAALEAAAGPLPDPLKAFWSQRNGSGYHGPLHDEIASVDAALQTWTLLERLRATEGWGELDPLVEPDEGVHQTWFRSAWVPFTDRGNGDHLVVDLDPPSAGARGQVVEYLHDDGRRARPAPSFAAWLDARAADLEAGRVVVTEGRDGEYWAMLPAAALRGSLVDLRIRGEGEEAWRTRVHEAIHGDPVQLAIRIVRILRRQGHLHMPHEVFLPLHLPALAEAAGADTPLRWRANALLQALRAIDDVEVHCDVAHLAALIDGGAANYFLDGPS